MTTPVSALFISGWSCPQVWLRPLADALAPSVDLRAVGLSALLEEGRSQPMAGLSSYASGVISLMRNQAGPVWLGGWSMGGMVALECAAAVPERVCGLILVGSTLRFCSDGPDSPGMERAAVRAMAMGLRRDVPATMERFYALAAHPFKPGPVNTDCSADALIHGLTYLQETDLRALACRVERPALVIHGDQDAVVPVGAGRQLALSLPGGRWLTYEGAGHDIPVRWPGRLAKDVGVFVRQGLSDRPEYLAGDEDEILDRHRGQAGNRERGA